VLSFSTTTTRKGKIVWSNLEDFEYSTMANTSSVCDLKQEGTPL
jgi:hypothetical protein